LIFGEPLVGAPVTFNVSRRKSEASNKQEGATLPFAYVFALMVPTIVLAQAPDPAVAGHQQPTTKIEAFSVRTGIVVIKGFSTIGSVAGQGRVSVDAREFRDASNPKSAEYGIAIEVKESSRLERESRSFVDQD
jgi:hypothetical protein